jgi:hypothetical protein
LEGEVSLIAPHIQEVEHQRLPGVLPYIHEEMICQGRTAILTFMEGIVLIIIVIIMLFGVRQIL